MKVSFEIKTKQLCKQTKFSHANTNNKCWWTLESTLDEKGPTLKEELF